MSILIGAFLMHGIVPGPAMLSENLDITYVMVICLALANVLGAGLCFLLAPALAAATLALLESDNLPGLAEAMRRDLQAAARTAESEHQNFGHQASALLENTKDVDTSAPSDERVLSELAQDATRHMMRLEERRAAQDKADRARAQALEQIAAAEQPEDLANIAREREQKEGLIQIEKDQQRSIDAEIEKLRGQGVDINPDNLMVAENTPLILPVHGELDRAREAQSSVAKIGTTGRGIGPAYEDKVGRRGLRLPLIAAPMLRVSGVELVSAACCAGVKVGAGRL